LAASITFWAKDQSPNLGAQVIGPNELVRARRNLEKILAEDVGAPNLADEVLRLIRRIETEDVDDARLSSLRRMLGMLQIPEDGQLRFLNETFVGRFGFDLRPFV